MNAGVIAEAKFGERVKGPLATWGDGEAGRAIAEDGLLNDGLNHVFGGRRGLKKLVGTHAVDQLVVEAMAADFVAALMNLPNQARVATCNPAEHKESCLGVIAIQQFEQPVGAGLNPGRLMFPIGKGNALGRDFGVEIIFQVDGERMAGASAGFKRATCARDPAGR